MKLENLNREMFVNLKHKSELVKVKTIKKKRTDFEVCKSIFEVLFQKNIIHKSDLRKLIGLSAKSINKWIDLITFIQSQPDIIVTKKGRYEILEIKKQEVDTTIYPETIEALKLMKKLIELPPEELKKKLEILESKF